MTADQADSGEQRPDYALETVFYPFFVLIREPVVRQEDLGQQVFPQRLVGHIFVRKIYSWQAAPFCILR